MPDETAVYGVDPIEQVKKLLATEKMARDLRTKMFETLESVLFQFGQADFRLSTERLPAGTILSFRDPGRRGGNLVQLTLDHTQVSISAYGREYIEVTNLEMGQGFIIEKVVEALTRANITDFPSTWVH